MRIAAVPLLAAMILVPTASMFPEPPQRDVPRELDEARSKLRSAHQDLTNAGTDWNGHKSKAMDHIDAAIKELDEAEHWAREHHAMR